MLRTEGGSRREEVTSPPSFDRAVHSGGEVRVLHGVEAVDGGEQGRVGQVQAVRVGHMAQRLHVSVQVLETWETKYSICVTVVLHLQCPLGLHLNIH